MFHGYKTIIEYRNELESSLKLGGLEERLWAVSAELDEAESPTRQAANHKVFDKLCAGTERAAILPLYGEEVGTPYVLPPLEWQSRRETPRWQEVLINGTARYEDPATHQVISGRLVIVPHRETQELTKPKAQRGRRRQYKSKHLVHGVLEALHTKIGADKFRRKQIGELEKHVRSTIRTQGALPKRTCLREWIAAWRREKAGGNSVANSGFGR